MFSPPTAAGQGSDQAGGDSESRSRQGQVAVVHGTSSSFSAVM